jgi:tetratricopeptide (TPR) repeat protein
MRFSRLATIVSFVLALSLPGVIRAQQSPTYADEYALYQQASQATDVAKRNQLVLKFVSTYSKSELDPNISYLYATYLTGLRDQGKWDQVVSEAEKFLQYRPGDSRVAALAVEAYSKLGQTQKLIKFGTSLYSKAPSGATAYLVAKAYQSINDTVNFKKWAERTLQHSPDAVDMAVALMTITWREGDLNKTAAYGEKVLAALKGKNDPQTAGLKAYAYRALGQKAFLANDTTEAQKNFAQAAELDPMNDFAHMQLGYCYWRQGKTIDAINAFAKAVAINGSSARDARKELYNLLKAQYGDTSNAAKFIDAAKKELGIS